MARALNRHLVGVLAFGALALRSPQALADTQACRRGEDPLPWYVPEYVKLQSGGFLGLVTLGTGYTAWQFVDLGVYYGWVPAAVGGESIHTLAGRVGARVRGLCLSSDWNWVFVQGGLGSLFTWGDGFFQLSPTRYGKDDYYRATGRSYFLSLGSELELRARPGSLGRHSVYVEFTVLDEYARAYWLSPRTISPWEIASSSVGYRLWFD